MSKKKTDKLEDVNLLKPVEEIDPKVLAAARAEVRKGLKEKFGEYLEVSDEDADDAFYEQAKKEFLEKTDEYKNKTYHLADADKALAYAEFLKEYNEHFNYWDRTSWRGIIQFNKVITKHIEDLKADSSKGLEIDYSTLIFLYNSMKIPFGVGIESARIMARYENYDEVNDKPFDEISPVTYSGVYEQIVRICNELAAIDKMLKLYRERVQMAAGGIKTNFKITEVEEFVKFHNDWLLESVENPQNAEAVQPA